MSAERIEGSGDIPVPRRRMTGVGRLCADLAVRTVLALGTVFPAAAPLPAAERAGTQGVPEDELKAIQETNSLFGLLAFVKHMPEAYSKEQREAVTSHITKLLDAKLATALPEPHDVDGALSAMAERVETLRVLRVLYLFDVRKYAAYEKNVQLYFEETLKDMEICLKDKPGYRSQAVASVEMFRAAWMLRWTQSIPPREGYVVRCEDIIARIDEKMRSHTAQTLVREELITYEDFLWRRFRNEKKDPDTIKDPAAHFEIFLIEMQKPGEIRNFPMGNTWGDASREVRNTPELEARILAMLSLSGSAPIH